MIKYASLLGLLFFASTSFAASYLVSITEGKHEEDRIFDIYRERSEPDILYSLEANCKTNGSELECFDAKKKKSTYPKQSALTFDKKNYVSEGKLTLEDYYDPTRTPDDKRTPQQRAYDRNMKRAWGSDSPGNLLIRPSQPADSTLQRERKEFVCKEAVKKAMEYYYMAPQAFKVKATAETWQQEYEKCMSR